MSTTSLLYRAAAYANVSASLDVLGVYSRDARRRFPEASSATRIILSRLGGRDPRAHKVTMTGRGFCQVEPINAA
jgi:hypothetical protein